MIRCYFSIFLGCTFPVSDMFLRKDARMGFVMGISMISWSWGGAKQLRRWFAWGSLVPNVLTWSSSSASQDDLGTLLASPIHSWVQCINGRNGLRVTLDCKMLQDVATRWRGFQPTWNCKCFFGVCQKCWNSWIYHRPPLRDWSHDEERNFIAFSSSFFTFSRRFMSLEPTLISIWRNHQWQ